MSPSKKLKVLFVTSEVVPFVKTGGLADVSSALPQKLHELGHQVRILVPKYGAIDERKFKIHEVVRLKDLSTSIGKKEVNFSLRSSFLVGSKARVQIYFLDSKEYFSDRPAIYSDPLTGKDFPDNDERFILLARAVFELINKLGWVPDIIHCNDWQTGLVPLYLKTVYKEDPVFQNIKTIFTIHNISYQGVFGKSTFAKTNLPAELNSDKGLLHDGKVNFLKAALNYSDILSTVSPTYANELCDKDEFSGSLQKVLCKRKDDLFGIINGIDPLVWNPEKDKKIPKKYNIKKLQDKKINKKELAEKFGLEYVENRPIIGMIGRLNTNKGLDLLQKAFKEFMKLDVAFVLLGTGERKYYRFLEEAFAKYHGKFSLYLGFDDSLAHLIEAGSDMLLMPSRHEPCGLNQMYSLTYGTIPIVHRTGGLADTVEDFDPKTGNGNGFVFEKYDSTELLNTIKRAIDLYTNDDKNWDKLMKSGMKSNFSWMESSKNYIDLYKKLLS